MKLSRLLLAATAIAGLGLMAAEPAFAKSKVKVPASCAWVFSSTTISDAQIRDCFRFLLLQQAQGRNITIQDSRSSSSGPKGAPGLNGAKGDKGDKGDTGPQGPAGQDGADGADGADGQDGAQGPQGETGPQGPAGPQGPKGDKGSSGNNH